MMLKHLGAWLRILLVMVMVGTVAAIGLGRANPKAPTRRVAFRPSYQVLDRAITVFHGGEVFIVDLKTGRLDTLPLPPGVVFDKASLSPWEEEGRRQIVGIGWNHSGNGDSLQRTDIGLVRMSLPDGEILDRLTLPDMPLPRGAPCWIPGAPAGVLYVGTDFRLYRVDLEPSRLDGGVKAEADHRPRPLEWQFPLPGADGVEFMDLCWPDEPNLGGRALASLRFKDCETGRWTDWEIWWLQLDRDGASIVAAGRLLQPNLADVADSRRLPNLVNVCGEPALAYFLDRPGESGYQLRVAPIHLDPDSGSPHAHEVDSQTLAGGCPPTGPIVSADGRWITVVRTSGPHLRSERIAVPGSVRTGLASPDCLLGCHDLRSVVLGLASP